MIFCALQPALAGRRPCAGCGSRPAAGRPCQRRSMCMIAQNQAPCRKRLLACLSCVLCYVGLRSDVYDRPVSVSSREIIKALEAAGWRRVRVRGDHHQYKHEGSPFLVTVPHPLRDIAHGTLRSIERRSRRSRPLPRATVSRSSRCQFRSSSCELWQNFEPTIRPTSITWPDAICDLVERCELEPDSTPAAGRGSGAPSAAGRAAPLCLEPAPRSCRPEPASD